MFFTISVGMLHLAAYRGFAVLDVSLPVNGVVGNLGKSARTAVDTIFNGGKLWVIFDFISLFQSQICAIPIDNMVILTQQLRRHGTGTMMLC